MKRTTFALCCALAVLVATQAASNDKKLVLKPPLWVDADDKDIPEPKERDVSEIYDVMRNSWLRHLDFGYLGLKAAHRPALNVNAWDEVPDSSWFTNRIGLKPITVEELMAGAPGVEPQPGTWEVLQLKTEGYTPGIQFRDTAGERYVLKFDLAAAPERNSAADKIGSLLMHAAGYYAPHNTIAYFRASDLELDEEAVYEDLLGRKRPMTRNDLDAALATLVQREDGTYRGLASHFVPGIPKGHFPYWGTRKDDPNDIIPHELRRELRGFRVIASWFNHVDVKEINTLDVYMKTEGAGFLRHYFIDFGSTMGSGDFMNGPNRVGHEHLYDGAAVGKSLVSFGGWQRPWDAECGVIHPEVGHFEADLFRPPDWKANYPNLAFVEMDNADAYWGAKIVTAFSNDLVHALAKAGEYRSSEITNYVEDVFRERRDKIGRYWFDVVSALEDFGLDKEPETWTLRFRDLAIDRGYADPGNSTYSFVIRDVGLRVIGTGLSKEVGVVSFEAPGDLAGGPTDRWGRTPFLAVDIHTYKSDGTLALPVRLVIGLESSSREMRLLGWAHAPR
jgi:hypothetical protein